MLLALRLRFAVVCCSVAVAHLLSCASLFVSWYVETHNAINFANYIFDYNGWSSSIKEFTVDFIDNRDGRWFCGLSCIIRVSLKDGTFHEVRNGNRGRALSYPFAA